MRKIKVEESVLEYLLHIAEEYHQELLGYHNYVGSDTKMGLELLRIKYLSQEHEGGNNVKWDKFSWRKCKL